MAMERFPVPLLRRVGISLIAMVVAWLAFFLVNLAYGLLNDLYFILRGYPSLGSVREWFTLLFWSGIIIFPAWFFIAVPVVALVDHRTSLFRWPVSIFFGALCGEAAFFIISMSSFQYGGGWRPSILDLYAMFVGAVFLPTYVRLVSWLTAPKARSK
jgi:hypothetical protein